MTNTHFWKLEIFQISLIISIIGYSWFLSLFLVSSSYEMLQKLLYRKHEVFQSIYLSFFVSSL